MRVERQAGYEYKGWELGEKVKFKNDGKVYKIVGFDEEENFGKFIAIDSNCKDHETLIYRKKFATSILKSNSNKFFWVSENEIEKIETKKSNGGKIMLKRDMLRGVVSELQKRTGVRVSATRHLTSQEDCYNAILEIGKRKAMDKRVEVLTKVNRSLNELNCVLKKENSRLEKKVKKYRFFSKITLILSIITIIISGVNLCNL